MKIDEAHIMVVGCGALGNEVLKNLALMGVQHLVIVDFDHVESDNLSRSVLFSQEDAATGRRKVDAAAKRLKELNPTMEIETIFGDIAYDVGLGFIRCMDVVIGCVDNRWARYCINRLCMRAGKPWVDGGIDGLEGTARVFMPGENCYACNLGPEGLKDMARRMPCAGAIRRDIAAGKAPTTSIVASIIGAVEVQEAMKIINDTVNDNLSPFTSHLSPFTSHLSPFTSHLSPFTSHLSPSTSLCGNMFYYEGEHLTTKLVKFKAFDDDCPVHEKWSPIEKSTLNRENTVAELLNEQKVGFSLGDDCFVDYVVRRDDNSRWKVMLPSHKVSAFVETDEQLKGIPLSGFYQHEWREINMDFPYQKLKLSELGIPAKAVLKMNLESDYRYVEIQ